MILIHIIYIYFQISIVVLYAAVIVLDAMFIITVIFDRKLRSEPQEWLPLAMVISTCLSAIFIMSLYVGSETSTPSWNNVYWLCLIIYPIYLTVVLGYVVLLNATICTRIIVYNNNVMLGKLASIIIIASCISAILIWKILQVYALTDGMTMYNWSKDICSSSPESYNMDDVLHGVAEIVLLIICIVGTILYSKSRAGAELSNKEEIDSLSSEQGMTPRHLLGCSLVVGFAYLLVRVVQYIIVGVIMGFGTSGIVLPNIHQYLGITALAIIPTLWIALHASYRDSFKRIFLACIPSHTDAEKIKLLA